MKLVRTISLVVLLGLSLAIGLSIVTFDTKRFLPLITDAAQKQGFALQVGSIELTLWPELGLKLTQLQLDSISHPGPAPLLVLQEATLAIPLKPLLAGELQVRDVRFSEGAVNLWQNKTGDNNWSSAAASQPANNPSSQTHKVSVNSLTLQGIKLNWQDDKNPLLSATLKQAGIELTGTDSYLLTLMGRVEARGTIPALAFELTQDIQQADGQWLSKNGKGKLGVADGISVLIHYNSQVAADFNKVTGNFSTEPFNPAAYLPLAGVELADKSRLKSLALKTDFAWQADKIDLSQGLIQLDDVPINWQAHYTGGRWQLSVKASKLDADAYMPVTRAQQTNESEKTEPTAAALSGLPLMDIDAHIGQLTLANYVLNDLETQLALGPQQINARSIAARLFDGVLTGQLRINQREKSLNLQGALDAKAVALQPLWKHFNPQSQLNLTGAVNAQVQLQSSAAGFADLFKALNAQVTTQGDAVRVSPLNITQQYCNIISQATLLKKDSNTWPEFTQLQDVTAKIQLTPEQIKLTELHGRTEKLQLDGEGIWERQSDQFKVQLPITLLQLAAAETTVEGCTIGSDYWVNRRLSLLQCEGKMAQFDPKRDCGLDKLGVAGLLKDYALYKIKKGEGINVGHIKEKAAEKKAELKEKIEEVVDKEKIKKVEDKLKGLFKRD
ncbi:MAG: AsmA family protein [Marinagarivorans sp.]